MSFVILFAWLVIAITLTLIGTKTGFKSLIAIGAVMLLSMTAIANVSY